MECGQAGPRPVSVMVRWFRKVNSLNYGHAILHKVLIEEFMKNLGLGKRDLLAAIFFCLLQQLKLSAV